MSEALGGLFLADLDRPHLELSSRRALKARKQKDSTGTESPAPCYLEKGGQDASANASEIEGRRGLGTVDGRTHARRDPGRHSSAGSSPAGGCGSCSSAFCHTHVAPLTA
jgi:hypothetical protein